MSEPTKTIEVAITRLPGWIERFAERHGEVSVQQGTLVAADGVRLTLSSWSTAEHGPTVPALLAWAQPPMRLGVVLIRRGGYAVACTEGEAITARKVGRRHVQSRTAAGGWSQQRFARRRGNQAEELVSAVVEHAERILGTADLDGLVRGGDRTLVSEVIQAPRLKGAARLPTRDFFDVPDPRLEVVHQVVVRARSVRIVLPASG